MADGFKSGGRRKGSLNRRTVEASVKLDALGCDPLEGAARIAMDESIPIEVRGRMYAELAVYMYPKRRAIDFKDLSPQRPSLEMSDAELTAILSSEGAKA